LPPAAVGVVVPPLLFELPPQPAARTATATAIAQRITERFKRIIPSPWVEVDIAAAISDGERRAMLAASTNSSPLKRR
jgi:hypothetical protein